MSVTSAGMTAMLNKEHLMKIECQLLVRTDWVCKVHLIREIVQLAFDAAQNPADSAVKGADISSAGCSSGPKCLWEQEVLPAPQPPTMSYRLMVTPRSNLFMRLQLKPGSSGSSRSLRTLHSASSGYRNKES